MVSSLSVDYEVALILKIDCTLSLPMKRQIVSTMYKISFILL